MKLFHVVYNISNPTPHQKFMQLETRLKKHTMFTKDQITYETKKMVLTNLVSLLVKIKNMHPQRKKTWTTHKTEKALDWLIILPCQK